VLRLRHAAQHFKLSHAGQTTIARECGTECRNRHWLRRLVRRTMPGFKTNELMHEWMQADSPEFDIEPERITAELARDNDIMLQLIKELGGELELRKRLEALSA